MDNSNTLQNTKCWNTVGIYGDKSCDKLDSLSHCRHCRLFTLGGKSLLDRPIPEGAVKQWTEQYSEAKITEKGNTLSVVIFRLKDEWLAFRTTVFKEAVEMRSYHTVPGRTNNIFKGLVNINGELLLLISLEDILDIQGMDKRPESGNRSVFKRMVVTESNSETYVFSADEMLGVQNIDPNTVVNAPATVTKSPDALCRHVFMIKEKKVGLLDEQRFFDFLDRRLKW